MAQITWRNVNTPNFGSANALLGQAGEQITQGADTLRGLAQEQTELANINYQTGRETNTASLQQAINQAQTSEELAAIDTTQFGAQVDQSLVANSLGKREDTLIGRQQEAANLIVKQDKLKLEQDKASQPVFKDDNNGTIHKYDPFTGEKIGETNYSKQFRPNISDQLRIGRLNRARKFKQQTSSMFKDYSDPNAFQSAVTDMASQDPSITTEEANKYVKDAVDQYNTYYSFGAEDQLLIDQQSSANDVAAVQYNDAINLNQTKLESALGFPAEVLTYQDDESVSLTDAQANWKDKTEAFGNINAATAYSNMVEILGKPPTGQEYNYIMAQADQAAYGYISQSDIRDATSGYKGKVIGSPHRTEIQKYLVLADKIKSNLDRASDAASSSLERSIRSRKVGGIPVTVRKPDLVGIDELSKSMDSVITGIADGRVSSFKRITGFEKN